MATPFDRLMELMRESTALCVALVSMRPDSSFPAPARSARGKLIKSVSETAHRHLLQPEIARLLDELSAHPPTNPLQQRVVERLAATVRWIGCVDPTLSGKIDEHRDVLTSARSSALSSGNFAAVAPALEHMLDLLRCEAQSRLHLLPAGSTLGDAMFEDWEPGFSLERFVGMMANVRERLRPLIDAARTDAKPNGLRRDVPTEEVQRLTANLLHRLGVTEFEWGKSSFTRSLGPGHSRVTIAPTDPFRTARTAVHETGHLITQLGEAEWLRGIHPFGFLSSMALSETVPLLMESMAARSRPFWNALLAREPWRTTARHYGWSADDVHRHLTEVRPGLIRLKADELIYLLHILARFDLEMEMVEGRLRVADLPDAWAAKCVEYLGREPQTPQEGCLQDPQWYFGYFFYFETYPLAMFIAAQLRVAFQNAYPHWRDPFTSTELTDWLEQHVIPTIRLETIDSLLERVTGGPLNPNHWLEYADQRYGAGILVA